VAVIELVGEPARHDPAGDWPRLRCGRIVDDVVASRARQSLLGKLALHGTDDVAPLAHAAKHVLDPFGETPTAGDALVGETEMLQLLQAARPQRLVERIAVARADLAVAVHVAQQPPVDAGQPLLPDLVTKSVLDLEV